MPKLTERLASQLSQHQTPRRSTRANAQSSLPKRFRSIASIFERKSQVKDPAGVLRQAETDRSKERVQQMQQTNISTLTDISLLNEDSNQLLTQIIEEVKNLQVVRTNQPPPNPMPDIDFGIDRQNRRNQRGRGRSGSKPSQHTRNTPTRPNNRPATRIEPRLPQSSTATVPEVRPPATPPRPTVSANIGRQLSRQGIRQSIGPRIRQTIADRVTTKIPALGLLFTLFFAGQRAAAGDLVGAGLELASGAAAAAGPLTFGFGTAVSIGLDIASLARDVYGDVYGVNIEDDPRREERLSTLSAAIREEVEEMISSAPRPQAPPVTSETRNQLVQLYRQAQDDDTLRAIIGDDVMAGIVPLLQIDPTRPGLVNQRARDGMQSTIDQIQRRLTRNRVAAPLSTDLETRTSADDANAVESGDTRSIEDLLQLIRTSEFNNIELEAEKIKFDGEIKHSDANQVSTDLLTPTSSPTIGGSPVAAMEEAPAAAAPQAQALVGGGTEMAVADQQQIRSVGQQVIVPIQTPVAPEQTQQTVRLGHTGRGEVPLNIRLEKQVA